MENSLLSEDSLGETELDRLRDSIKQKDQIIAEKSEIINSLRQQVNDLNHELVEMETNQQLLHQKVDRLTKDLTTREEELEAVSHALREIETANENLTRRINARTEQVQKFVEDLVAAKKDLEEARGQNEELKHKNERLTIELDMANSSLRSLQKQQENTGFGQCPETNQTQATRQELASTLHFQIAEEIGEIMDSSSVLPPKMFSDTRQISEPKIQAPHPAQVKMESASWSPKIRNEHIKLVGTSIDESHNANKQQPQIIRQARSLDIENSSVKHCENHRLKKPRAVENQVFDPIEEYKMRMARANELARRNMQTKPLHQTSYPLELDTFDTTDLTEFEIKSGNVRKQPARPPQRPPPLPPVTKNNKLESPHRPQEQKLRKALANCSNTPPVARRIYKKAEAFIV